MKVLVLDAPGDYAAWLGDLPEGLSLVSRQPGQVEAAHIFVTKTATLAGTLSGIRKRLRPDGFVWVSWPKKASKVDSEVTEDVVREVALPLGLVDVKVCAVSDVWSGLKLVIRKSQR